MPIGVFDSGLGGLTVWAALAARLPEQGFVYLGDNAHAPYGPKSPEAIYDLTCVGVERLFQRGCKLVVLACNTASAVALRRMQEEWVPSDRRVLGVFVPMIEVLAKRSWADKSRPRHVGIERVALFATKATVDSGAFARELALRAKGVEVFSQACVGLVDAIEVGDMVSAELMVRDYVIEMTKKCPEPQVAVLGCTHYPLVQDLYERELPPGTLVLSQPAIVAESMADYLRRHPEFASAGETVFLTTGDAAEVSQQAHRFLGMELGFQGV